MWPFLYVVASALLLASSFYGFVPGVFLFLIPLYYVYQSWGVCFFQGYCWGVLFFGLHSYDFFLVTFRHGFGLLRLLFPALWVAYAAVFAGCWFASLMVFTKKRRAHYKPLIFIAITLLYFWFNSSLLFWFAGHREGHPLCFPLLPFIAFPILTQIVQFVGAGGLCALLVIFQVGLVELWYDRRWLVVLGLIIVLIAGGGIVFRHQHSVPDWVHKTVFVPLPSDTVSVYERVQLLLQKNLRKAQLILLPESFFPIPVDKHSLVVQSIQEYVLNDDQYCIFGAHQNKEGKLYNSFLFVNKSRIIETYDKSHLIPFFEYLPYNWPYIKEFFKFFLLKRKPFAHGCSSKKTFMIGHWGPFYPVICSELFFVRRPPLPAETVLICLGFDSYFTEFGMGRFMLWAAQWVALTEHRAILYCASRQAYFINPNGTIGHILTGI